MAESVYEAMFIFDSSRYARDPVGVANQVAQWVTDVGGEVLASRLWEERRLAYPIKGQRKGTYWLSYFRIDTLKLAEIDRQCEIDDTLLRHLFLKVDARLVDTLVEHAKSGAVRQSEPAKADGKPNYRRGEVVAAAVAALDDDEVDLEGVDAE